LLDDLRHAVRSIARAKAPASALLLSLALGTGANAAIYSVLDALLFRAPAGVATAADLVTVYTSQFNGAAHGLSSYPDYLSIKAGATSFGSIAAFDEQAIVMVRFGASIHRVRTAAVSRGFFDVLGMSPHIGHFRGSAGGAEGRIPAVISYTLWKALGAHEGLIGETIDISGVDYSIAGVTPPRFDGLQLGRRSDVWIPLIPAPADADRGDRRLSLIGRLKPSARLKDLQSELGTIATTLATQYPETNRGTLTDEDEPRVMTAAPYSRLESADRARASLIGALIFGATVLLLVSACVNAGSLLLSRAASRGRELAVKVALGASRSRLVREILAESLFVSIAGGALGLLLAFWTAASLPSLFAPEHADLLDTRLSARMVAFAVALSCVAGALFGLAPATQALRSDPATALRGDPGGVSDQHGGGRLRAALVVCQVALSTVLLIGAGLLVQSLTNALRGDFGFGMRNVAIVSVENPGGPRDPPRDVLKGIRFQAKVGDALQKAGVRAGWVGTLPLIRTESQEFQVESRLPGVKETVELDVNVASSGYFRALWIPAIEGRLFDERDGALADPVVVVNDVLAYRYFGGGAAVGRDLIDASGTALEIVGVVRSGKYRTLQDSPRPMVYYPLAQRYLERVNLVVRTDGDPGAFLRTLADRLTEIDPGVTILRASTLESHLLEALVLDRLATTLVGGCGVLALVLATIGVYGAVADAVRRRTREIGLRIALGAGPMPIVRLVFGEGVHLAVAGVLVGIGAAACLVRVAQSVVDGVPPLEIATLAIVPVALTLVVVVAAAVPAARALRVNPTVALRDS
jgi:predicted permease